MFGLIRLIIGCLLGLFIIVIVLRKSTLVRWRRRYIASAIIALVLVVISAFIPFENAFLTFSSPESAYNYYILGDTKVKLVVRGQCCDFVVGEKNNSDVHLIVPKTDDGWKVGLGVHTKQISQKVVNDAVVTVYQYKDTNDFFVTVLDVKGEPLKITDSSNSNFCSIARKNSVLDKDFRSYYASVSNLNDDYWININGTVVFYLEDST